MIQWASSEQSSASDLSRYPAAISSPYRLPWPAGVSLLCVQSNRGLVSHRGTEEFAYDFAMPVGSDVCAARAGVVHQVVVEHDSNGFNAPNNFLYIEHEDGTFGYYGHLKQAGSYVTVGDSVQQGQRIAASGNVGYSLLPHLHFHVVLANGQMIPITFADVTGDAGVPRMFKRYTSGNDPHGAAAVMLHLLARCFPMVSRGKAHLPHIRRYDAS